MKLCVKGTSDGTNKALLFVGTKSPVSTQKPIRTVTLCARECLGELLAFLTSSSSFFPAFWRHLSASHLKWGAGAKKKRRNRIWYLIIFNAKRLHWHQGGINWSGITCHENGRSGRSGRRMDGDKPFSFLLWAFLFFLLILNFFHSSCRYHYHFHWAQRCLAAVAMYRHRKQNMLVQQINW